MRPFIKKRINLSEVTNLKKQLRSARLHTVCEGARCPNIGECFSNGTATFLIAGDTCTRGCRFCAVNKGVPSALDPGEPERAAHAVKALGLSYIVITSVTRDDLPDGGAEHFSATVKKIREITPRTAIELLVPDFGGNTESMIKVFSSKPDVLSHNLETVPRLYPLVRQKANYQRSLELISLAKKHGLTTKSGLMLGLGETEQEVLDVMKDLKNHNCDKITLGQYLAPSKNHFPVNRYLPPEEFEQYSSASKTIGFTHCLSGTYVRSSYNAGK